MPSGWPPSDAFAALGRLRTMLVTSAVVAFHVPRGGVYDERVVAPGFEQRVGQRRDAVERRVRVDAERQRDHIRREPLTAKRRERFGPLNDAGEDKLGEPRSDELRGRVAINVLDERNEQVRTTQPHSSACGFILPVANSGYDLRPEVVIRALLVLLHADTLKSRSVAHLVLEDEVLAALPNLASVLFGAGLRLADGEELHECGSCD